MDEKEENKLHQEVIKKYGIDLKKLIAEQGKLAEGLEIKDTIDPLLIEKFGAFDTSFIKNKILCCYIVCNKEFEIIDRAYVLEKVKFPYIPGFRSYRELPAMIAAYEQVNEQADAVFISAQGIIHPRLGLASHFGLVKQIPTIGVSSVIVDCKVDTNKDGANILKKGKKQGRVLIGKEESKPLFVSPGNHISVASAYELSKKLIIPPRKWPEPLRLATKYAKKVKEELSHQV